MGLSEAKSGEKHQESSEVIATIKEVALLEVLPL